MTRCSRCVLPATFPGITFDAEGVCNFCREQPPLCNEAEKKARARARFERLVGRVRRSPGIQCLMAYSGGKDSTYTLMVLRRVYGLRVLAVTLDNGFISPQAFANGRRVVEALDADQLTVKPRIGLLRRIFAACAFGNPFPAKTLERASSICNACMGLVKSVALRVALERRVPIVAWGWSPGQAPVSASAVKLSASMVARMQATRAAPLLAIAGEELRPYLPDGRAAGGGDGFIPHATNPLAFLDYDEHRIVSEIEALGWRPPDDTDGNSTNCLLNSYANRIHLRRYGFHPYAFEIAGLVRRGLMDRSEGLAKLSDLGSRGAAEAVARRLHLEVTF
ncbi:MAG: adenine nucleotide alpha hydrolase family protein [Planctomycetota bacterium]|jgi:tRNA(Ile)-lysidine synthase TilS/MesJ